jgi:RNA polymerase sigma-70 factor (ECF subfamily)
MEESLKQVLAKDQTRAGEPSDRSQEIAWILACQRGDTLGFNRLVLKWEKRIYNLNLRMLQDQDEAAEATQEVFCSAFKNIRHFRQEAKFSTWLYRIAVNHCISRLRKRPPGMHLSLDDSRPEGPLKDWAPSSESHEAQVLVEEQRRQVRRALGSLPEDQRAVVQLKFYEDLTFEEIAAVVQAPLSTIKSRLYAGLSILKTRLGGRSLNA